MPAGIQRRVLVRRWLHSHEEDTGAEVVYRPASWGFPPARGRSGFELKQDGTLLHIAPGPADRPQESAGRWRLDGNLLVLEAKAVGEAPRTLHVVSASEDRLVVGG
jgi:hypothetical protein